MPKVRSGPPTHNIKLNHGSYNPRTASMPLYRHEAARALACTVRANAAATETLEKPSLLRGPPVPRSSGGVSGISHLRDGFITLFASG